MFPALIVFLIPQCRPVVVECTGLMPVMNSQQNCAFAARKAELAWKLQARNLQACKAASLKISKLEEIKGEDAAPPRQMHQVHCRPYDGEDTDDAKTQKKQQKHRKRQNTKSRVSVEAASAESASVQGC